MDWARPASLIAFLPLAALLAVFHGWSFHPMPPWRRWLLFAIRSSILLMALLAYAGPAYEKSTYDQSVVFVLDHSRSMGDSGLQTCAERAGLMMDRLPRDSSVGFVSTGNTCTVIRMPSRDRTRVEPAPDLMESDGAQTDLASAVALAGGLFPPGTARRIVILSDGIETRGDLLAAARNAALADVVIDAVPVAGEARPDARIISLLPSRSRLHEGASLSLSAAIESSLAGEGTVRLFENGIEVERRPLSLEAGREQTVVFRRTPEQRNLYTYRVRVEGFDDDAVPENNESITLVEVRGRPLLLYVEGDRSETHYLADAMAREGIRLDTRPVQAVPQALQDLAGYDGIVLSDVPAYELPERFLSLVKDYVEQLGGGFVMIGGIRSFGVGGYYRTPVEDILPVKMKPPDKEERFSTALVLVIDRSGSMEGQKIEICKSAASATIELLSRKDYAGVVAFDSSASWIVPLTRVTSPGAVARQIMTINAGGGTNIYPGMTSAREALNSVSARVKHMIVLSDGQTTGAGYQALAAQMNAEEITISTVAVGQGADTNLLAGIAAAGGGEYYFAAEAKAIPQIFTQDAMRYMGRLIHEEAFAPRQVEKHPMLKGWNPGAAPQLLGYVETNRKATAQVPLVTDRGDPLLAHWRYGLGKVTAFTSDCKSRWSALWIANWSGYSQFWAQILRETAREPQGRHMDIRIAQDAGRARVSVDLLEDAAEFRNNALVTADVYFVPVSSLGSNMRHVEQLVLQQDGPGCYSGSFVPARPGVYLVRAQSGAEMVSAGLVHNASAESATGRTDTRLLENACAATGGTLIRSPEDDPGRRRRGHSRFVELRPLILKIILVLFILDLAVRRWENLLGMFELVSDVLKRLRRKTPAAE
ncbi:MAG: VWA domain-containing protein [Planctomycetes bacterium]|nr:VWA domain-containing protein [Planctomycetota bacterium]